MDHILRHDRVTFTSGGMLELLERVLRDGFAIVDGIPTAPLSVLDFVDHIAFVEESHFDRHFEVRSKPSPVNLAYTSGVLPPHNDLRADATSPVCSSSTVSSATRTAARACSSTR
jgi:hypothetical protein